MAMEAIASHVIAKIPLDYLVSRGYLAEPRVRFVRTMGNPATASRWETLYQKCIVESEQRNKKIIKIAHVMGNQNGIPTIVLVRRRQHADDLASRIPNAEVAKGGEGILTSKTIQRFKRGDIPVLVGTTVLGEGVDLPNAGVLVYGSAGGEGVQMMQSYFRPLTFHPGKQAGYIYDFRDMFHEKMLSHSQRRFDFAANQLGAHRVLDL